MKRINIETYFLIEVDHSLEIPEHLDLETDLVESVCKHGHLYLKFRDGTIITDDLDFSNVGHNEEFEYPTDMRVYEEPPPRFDPSLVPKPEHYVFDPESGEKLSKEVYVRTDRNPEGRWMTDYTYAGITKLQKRRFA